MKRLLLWIVLLTILFSSGIALAARAGGDAPLPAFAQWFTYPDGKPCPMPCLFGIRPGVTKFDNAQAIINAHPLTNAHEAFFDSLNGIKSFTFNHILWNHSAEIIVKRGMDQTVAIVCLCNLVSQKSTPTFRDILYLFGKPQSISLSYYNDSESNYLFFDKLLLEAKIWTRDHPPNCLFTAADPTMALQIYAAAEYQQERAAANEYETIYSSYNWVGFSRHTYWLRYYAPLGVWEEECRP
jgi:hypothetical protein